MRSFSSSRPKVSHLITKLTIYVLLTNRFLLEQGAGADNAPGHTDQGVPGDAKVASDSYTSNVGIDNKATNVPGEKGNMGQKVGEKPDSVSGSSMKS